MAYLGVSPSNGVRRVHTYTATASQTTFSGAGAENISLSYRDSTYIDVYQNGVKLADADYTATSGTSIVLGTGATASDLVVIVVFDVFSVADTVSKADGGTFDGNVTMGGTLAVTGTTAFTGSVSGLDVNGTEIILDADADTSITSDTDDQIDFKCGGVDRVIIGADGSFTSQPASGGTIVFNEASNDVDFRIETNDTANGFVINAGSNQVQIGTDNAAANRFWWSGISGDDGYAYFGNQASSSTNSVFYVNRNASDGVLIQFRQGNANEGDIAVSGSTVSYNGFSGRHESSGIPTNTPVGTVVSTIDSLDVYSNNTTDTEGNTITHPKAGQTRADHPKVKVSTSVGDPCVYGIVSEFNNDGKLIVASVGIGSIRVTGACSKGDLLESNGDGTAKVQSDDIIRSKTIGKVTIGNSNTSEKLVSCVMYCG